MSANRKHTAVPELGWADWLRLLQDDPYVRAEGHDHARTHEAGRLVRFNRQVEVLTSTVDGLTVKARTLRRVGERRDLLVPTNTIVELNWHELDWVSWEPWRSADGRRFKVTTEGQSTFGEFEVWDDNRVVHLASSRVWDFNDRNAAVSAVVRMITAGGKR